MIDMRVDWKAVRTLREQPIENGAGGFARVPGDSHFNRSTDRSKPVRANPSICRLQRALRDIAAQHSHA
jgi:hypothetical protein